MISSLKYLVYWPIYIGYKVNRKCVDPPILYMEARKNSTYSTIRPISTIYCIMFVLSYVLILSLELELETDGILPLLRPQNFVNRNPVKGYN